MCIIVDANRLGALANRDDADAKPVRDWLARGGRIVYSTGGAYAREVGCRARDSLLTYDRAGKAKFVPAARFAADERGLRADAGLRSDDPHVLVLARAARVRLLYTGDRNLMADFRNKKFIDRPRGKIYSSAANAGLLTRSVCAAPAQRGG